MSEFKIPDFSSLASLKSNMPDLDRWSYVPEFKMPRIPSIWETQAEIFMEGLRSQVSELEARLKAEEELEMVCYQGAERLSVVRISMPSLNVVALTCIDGEGNAVQLTGHMNSVTFSFRVLKPNAPVKRNKIGFEMPSAAK